MSCGGSVGEGYGPMIVSPRAFTPSEIKTKRIAVPGTLTTAYLALQLFAPGSRNRSRSLRPDHPAGAGRKVRSRSDHPRRPADLRQGGPAPHCRSRPLVAEDDRLAFAAGRQRDPPRPWSRVDSVGHFGCLRESIQYALDHREEALSYAMQFARDLDSQTADDSSGCT